MIGWEVEPAEPWRGEGMPARPIVAGILAGLLIVAGGVQLVQLGDKVGKLQSRDRAQLVQLDRLRARVLTLEHACGPVDTGGGVTQCTQPNVLQAPPR